MAGAMKAPALDAVLFDPFERHRIVAMRRSDAFMKAGFEGRHEGDFRQFAGQQAHGGDVGRVVGRGHVGKGLHGRQHFFIHPLHASHSIRVDGLETNGRQFRGRAKRADFRTRQLRQAQPHGHGVIAGGNRRFRLALTGLYEATRFRRTDPLHPAARQQPLVRHVEQTILEAGAPQIGDEDFHVRTYLPKLKFCCGITPLKRRPKPRTVSTTEIIKQIIALFLAFGSLQVKKPMKLIINGIRHSPLQQIEMMIAKTNWSVNHLSRPERCAGGAPRPSSSTVAMQSPFIEVVKVQSGKPRQVESYYFTNTSSTVCSGRGMTWELTSSPLALAAVAPASTAARTEPTSPRTKVVTYAPPICTCPANFTLAALHIASVAAMVAISPFVSTSPNASLPRLLVAAMMISNFQMMKNPTGSKTRLSAWFLKSPQASLRACGVKS